MKKIFYLLLLVGFASTKVFSQNSAVLINGIFNCYAKTIIQNNQLSYKNSASAYFTYTPAISISPSQFEKAGNVKLNNKPFDYNNDQKHYGTRQDEILDFSQIEWLVSGHKDIPNMHFIYNGVFPIISNTINLPTVIKKSDSLFISIPSITNVDSIEINIWDDFDFSNRTYLVFKFKHYDNRVIYIPPSALTLLKPGGKAYISVEAVNYNYQTISDKNYLFCNYSCILNPNITITN